MNNHDIEDKKKRDSAVVRWAAYAMTALLVSLALALLGYAVVFVVVKTIGLL